MDIILITLIVVLLALNFVVIFFLIRNKHQKFEDPTQALKDEFNSFKDSFSQSFGNMSKDIAKDMSGALTRVDEKVGVFNKQVEALNKSQDNFSRILAGVKQYGVLAEFSLASLLKDLLPASQYIENVKNNRDTLMLEKTRNIDANNEEIKEHQAREEVLRTANKTYLDAMVGENLVIFRSGWGSVIRIHDLHDNQYSNQPPQEYGRNFRLLK